MEGSLGNYFLPESPKFPFSKGFQCFGPVYLTKAIFLSRNTKIILFLLLKEFFVTANLIVQLIFCQDYENMQVLHSNILNCEWHHHVVRRPEIFRKFHVWGIQLMLMILHIKHFCPIQLVGVLYTFPASMYWRKKKRRGELGRDKNVFWSKIIIKVTETQYPGLVWKKLKR